MNTIPDIRKQIDINEVLSVLEDKYSILGPLWTSAQLEWMNGSYSAFNNHDKFLIVIYIKKKNFRLLLKKFY